VEPNNGNPQQLARPRVQCLDQPEDEQITASSLALLHIRTPAILIANLINSTLTVVVFLPVVPPQWLATWLAVFHLILAVRGALWLRFRDQDQPDWHVKWGRVAEIGSYTGGLMWGVAGFAFFIPGSPVHLAMLVFVLGGMAAGALATLSAHSRAWNGYLLRSMSPFCARLAMEGDVASLVMAGMAGLFVVSLLISALPARSACRSGDISGHLAFSRRGVPAHDRWPPMTSTSSERWQRR
jgi:hypothetical protein